MHIYIYTSLSVYIYTHISFFLSLYIYMFIRLDSFSKSCFAYDDWEGEGVAKRRGGIAHLSKTVGSSSQSISDL